MSENCAATSEKKLMDFLMDATEAKSEAEWFASRIIADLRTKLAEAEKKNEAFRKDISNHNYIIGQRDKLQADLTASKKRIYTEEAMSAMQHERDAFCKQNLENCKAKDKRIAELEGQVADLVEDLLKLKGETK
ncbi:hypothetical protein LCGC14_0743140 [marine sediment metagenome]|uniref:Uncharacterized protein n=1 Tax=marine sediment metagenome TaxID=412755 RepID=A0A0F9QA99_9ZZZZ